MRKREVERKVKRGEERKEMIIGDEGDKGAVEREVGRGGEEGSEGRERWRGR